MRRTDRPRVAVITGGSSGIGLATALLFAARGWRVGLVARGRPALAAAQARLAALGCHCHVHAADVADTAALAHAARAIADALGPINLWVNAAGNGVYGPLAAVSAAEFDRVTATTYTGTVNGTRLALAMMPGPRPGVIVNVCSAMCFRGLPGLGSYAGAKAAVRGFSESTQIELKLAHSPVRLALVYPPAVNTPFFAHAANHMPLPPRPARPVYQPELVARAIHLAATTPRSRILVGSVTVAFELACRVAPSLVGWAIRRLGYAGQMTTLPAARAARDPSLFQPGTHPPTTRGVFPARETSVLFFLQDHRLVLGSAAAAIAGAVLGRKGKHFFF